MISENAVNALTKSVNQLVVEITSLNNTISRFVELVGRRDGEVREPREEASRAEEAKGPETPQEAPPQGSFPVTVL